MRDPARKISLWAQFAPASNGTTTRPSLSITARIQANKNKQFMWNNSIHCSINLMEQKWWTRIFYISNRASCNSKIRHYVSDHFLLVLKWKRRRDPRQSSFGKSIYYANQIYFIIILCSRAGSVRALEILLLICSSLGGIGQQTYAWNSFQSYLSPAFWQQGCFNFTITTDNRLH